VPRANEVKSVEDRKKLQNSIRGIELKPLPHMLALTNLILHDIEVPDITYDDALSKELTSITQKDRVDCILANPPFGGMLVMVWKQTFQKIIEQKRVLIYF